MRAKAKKGKHQRTPEEWAAIRARSQSMLRQALRDGTHSTTVNMVCPTCGEWCDGIYEGAKDATGKDKCLKCSAKMHGLTPDAYRAGLRNGTIK